MARWPPWGVKPTPKDRIEVDGEPITAAEALIYIALYKLRGAFHSQRARPRPTVLDLVPAAAISTLWAGSMWISRPDTAHQRWPIGQPADTPALRSRERVQSPGGAGRMRNSRNLATWGGPGGWISDCAGRCTPGSAVWQGAWLRVVMREGESARSAKLGCGIGLPVVKIIRLRIGSLRLGSQARRVAVS
jgi:23S rRNA pseudouridine2605 synthase